MYLHTEILTWRGSHLVSMQNHLQNQQKTSVMHFMLTLMLVILNICPPHSAPLQPLPPLLCRLCIPVAIQCISLPNGLQASICAVLQRSPQEKFKMVLWSSNLLEWALKQFGYVSTIDNSMTFLTDNSVP